MSSIEVLAAASNLADSGNGSGVSAEAHAVARGTWSVSADLGRSPDLVLSIDTGPTSSGPWSEIWTKHLLANEGNPSNPHYWHSPRVLLSGFDKYIRARWSGRARANTGINETTAKFALGLTLDCKPDA